MTDFSGKTVAMTATTLRAHTTGGNGAKRAALLGSLQDVLKNPDEVWLNDYKTAFNCYNYIKFYQGKAINVVCSIHDGKTLEVDTWLEIGPESAGTKLAKTADPRWRYRRGLLIKK